MSGGSRVGTNGRGQSLLWERATDNAILKKGKVFLKMEGEGVTKGGTYIFDWGLKSCHNNYE